MKASKRKSAACPTCAGTGKNLRNGTTACSNCDGAGSVSTQFPYDYWYPLNLTVTQSTPTGASSPSLVISGAASNPLQQGTNPARLQLGSDAPFEWLFNLIFVTSPTVNGDASSWLAVQLTDTSSESLPFSSSPLMATLWAGDAKNPWPHLDPPQFGPQTQLSFQGWPVNYTNNVFEIGVGDGSTTSFSGTIYGPVLQGSVVAGDTTAAPNVVGSDNGNGVIAGTGIAAGSSISTYQGPGVAITVTVKFSSAPASGHAITVTFTQGCALINAQFALQGFYLKDLTPGGVQPQPVVTA